MSDRIHVLAQQLFGKSSVAECDLLEIKNLVEHYPYFAPAQFLLLEKLKQDASPEYIPQLQKAVLYYHNPLEFEYFINSGKFFTDADSKSETSPINKDDMDGEIEVIDVEYVGNTEPVDANAAYHSVTEENEMPEETAPDIEPPSSIQSGQLHEPLNLLEKKLQQIMKPPAPDNNRAVELAEQKAVETDLPIPDSGALTFEPYHTVDYFASQGIKLSQEEVGKDKFGKQLKSFTEWLKTMKRLPAPQGMAQQETTVEKKVQHLAEDSVHASQVVTEAMAEVWIKQGNTDKAIEVYNKLSLLNPSKMAYFAAKIDHLKSS